MNGVAAVIHVTVENGLDLVNALAVNHVWAEPSCQSHVVICHVPNGVFGPNGRNVRSRVEAEQLQEIVTVRVRENAAEMISKSEHAIHQLVINYSLGQVGQSVVFHVVVREFKSDFKLAMTRHHHVMERTKFVSVHQEFVPNGLNGQSSVPVTRFAEAVLPQGPVNVLESASVMVQLNLRNLVIITNVLVGLIGHHGHLAPFHVVAWVFKIGHVLA